MPRARKRPTLTAPLGPDGRKRLAERVCEIQQRGAEARAKLAAKSGVKPGRGDAQRLAKKAARPDPLERRIAKAEANAAALANLGNRIDAARAERTAAELRKKLAKRQRAEAAAAAQEAFRAARLDRFALLVKRSEILTPAHYAIADAWLAALDAAADGEMARAAEPEAPADRERDGELAPALSGPAIFVGGGKALDRWSKAVPVAAVASGQRRLPPVFEPRRVKAPRASAQSGGPPPSLQEGRIARRTRAERIMEQFENGVAAGGFPGWCVPVAIRVILKNQGLRFAMEALGVAYWAKNQQTAQSAMAAGLSAIEALVDKSAVG